MNFARGEIPSGGKRPRKCRPIYNVPAYKTAKHRAKFGWPFGERSRCSNEAKTRNPLKFAGVPQTRQQISGSQPLVGQSLPYIAVNFSPITAEIYWRVWGTPANFDGFLVLASLLQRRRSPEANKLCTIFGRLLGWYATFTFLGSCPLSEFCQLQNSLCV